MSTLIEKTAEGTPAHTADPPKYDPKRWAAAAVMLTAVFMDLLDSTVVNVAIPSIQGSLSAGYAAIQWITAGYALTFSLLMITGGRLGDIVGRKLTFQVGVALFTLASLLCGLAVNPGMLAFARVLQGAGAAIMVPQVISIIHATFPPEEQGKAYGIFGGISGLAAVMGPILGGVLISWDLWGLGWRAIFLINVPVGIAGLIFGARLISESKSPHALKLDVPGVLLSTFGLLLLLFPLVQGRENDWPVWGFVSMILSVPVLYGFVKYQQYKTLKDGSPLVVLKLFKARSFVAGLGVQLGFFIAIGLFFLALNVFMQAGLGFTALRAGLTSVSFAIGAFISSGLAVAVLVTKLGRKVLILGAAVEIVGVLTAYWAVSANGIGMSSWDLVIPLILMGLGFGFLVAPLPVVVLNDVHRDDSGSASGLTNTCMQLGMAVGIAAVSIAFFAPLAGHAASSADDVTPKLRQELVAASVPAASVDAITASFKACAVDRISEKNPAVTPASCAPTAATQDPKVAALLAKYSQQASATSFVGGFKTSLLWQVGVLILVLLLTFGLPRTFSMEQGAPAAV